MLRRARQIVKAVKRSLFLRFVYATLIHKREPRVFQTRDGAALSEMSACLYAMGCSYQGLIYNYPREAGIKPPGRDAFGFVTADHWLVITSRPPIHDQPTKDFRRLHASGSDLEAAVFNEFRRYFEKCKRDRIRLTEAVGKALRKADCHFSKILDGRMVKYNSLDHKEEDVVVSRGQKGDPYKTLAFFLRVSGIPGYDCGVIACFGMSGIETLIWNRVVRMRYADWYTRDHFVVAELTIGRIPDRPITLDFINEQSVSVEILLDCPALPPQVVDEVTS